MKKNLAMFVFLCLFMSGCGVAPFIVSPIITGVIMWKQGEAHKYYNEEVKILYRATKASLKELDHPISVDKANSDGYYIVAGEKDKFKIKIRAVKPHIAEVAVRINIMGDKPYAELLYAQIDANTGTINYDDDGKPAKIRRRQKTSADTP